MNQMLSCSRMSLLCSCCALRPRQDLLGRPAGFSCRFSAGARAVQRQRSAKVVSWANWSSDLPLVSFLTNRKAARAPITAGMM